MYLHNYKAFKLKKAAVGVLENYLFSFRKQYILQDMYSTRWNSSGILRPLNIFHVLIAPWENICEEFCKQTLTNATQNLFSYLCFRHIYSKNKLRLVKYSFIVVYKIHTLRLAMYILIIFLQYVLQDNKNSYHLLKTVKRIVFLCMVVFFLSL